jgi:UDPglucose 6-dehydrogenase
LGKKVIFFDKNAQTITDLKNQNHHAYLNDKYDNQQIDYLFVCINTPSTQNGINLDYIKNSMEQVGAIVAAQKKNIIVIIRSTILPGTTENILLPLIEKYSNKLHGEGWNLAYQPEFLRAHSNQDDFLYPWITVIGLKNSTTSIKMKIKKLFSPIQSEIKILTIREAEFAKYINNLKLSTLISFANEMWLLGKKFDLDANPIHKIISEAYEPSWNPLYGTTGGYPFGGTCFPKDTKAMLLRAKEMGFDLPLLKAVVEVNTVLEKLAEAGIANKPIIKGINWKPSPRKPSKPKNNKKTSNKRREDKT